MHMIQYVYTHVCRQFTQPLTSTNAPTQLKGIGSTRAEQIAAVKAALDGDGDGAGALVREGVVVLVDGTLFKK